MKITQISIKFLKNGSKKPDAIQICKEDSIQEQMDGNLKSSIKKCDNKGKSIILIKLQNYSLFGGFAAIDWDSTNLSEARKRIILRCKIWTSVWWIAGISDLRLGRRNQNMNQYNNSNLGKTYKPPFGYKYGSKGSQQFFSRLS
ncbi:hypothetical protein M0813_11774 [Anaeramoeba flamelloides]|uniref:Uncharacterized protein n=1 Tax=Anaeramoeba flamelloides TaxID=1746091 RepID=A0ABQ8ZDL5_9EUKA|nr:hypothetical protein M0813_11774 [Anaeramoeba flamelloides]